MHVEDEPPPIGLTAKPPIKKAPVHEENRMKPPPPPVPKRLISPALRAEAQHVGKSMAPKPIHVEPYKAVISSELVAQAEKNKAVIDVIQQSIKELEKGGARVDDRMKAKIIEHLSPSVGKLDLDYLKHNGPYVGEELTKALNKNKSLSANFGNYTISKTYLAKVGSKLLEQHQPLADLRKANPRMMDEGINLVRRKGPPKNLGNKNKGFLV